MKRIALGSCLLVLSGCAAEAAPTVLYEARDSAGVRIVEYAETPQASRVITVAASPTWRFGDDPGEYEFEQVFVGALLPDGGAVVTDFGSNEVLSIRPDGTLGAVLARGGQGPTEVRRVSSTHTLGDGRVAVDDDGNGKVLIFQGDSLAGSLNTRDPDPRFSQGMRALGADGGVLMMATSSYSPDFEGEWLQGHLARYDLATRRVDTAAAFDMAAKRPDGPASPWGAFGIAGASGSLFVTGRSDLAELVWRGPDGAVSQILRWPAALQYPDATFQQRFEDYLRADLTRVNPGASQAQVEQIVERSLARTVIDPSQPLPLFVSLEGDGTDGVWIAPFMLASPATTGFPTYTVIAPDGEWLGTVTMPEGFRVLDVADGKVLGILKDEMDVQSVAVFEVTVAEPPAP